MLKTKVFLTETIIYLTYVVKVCPKWKFRMCKCTTKTIYRRCSINIEQLADYPLESEAFL